MVSGAANTTIYMYYGNSCILSATQSPTNVWDTNYKGVWHLHSDENDSTSTGNNGTNNGSNNLLPGKFADGQSFDGIDDYITTPSIELKTANNFTISLWFKADATNFTRHLLWQGQSTGAVNGWGNAPGTGYEQEMHLSFGGLTGGVSQNNYLTFFLGDTDDAYGNILMPSYGFSDTASWHHAAVVVTGLGSSPSAELFLDGASVASDTGDVARTNRGAWVMGLRFGRPDANERYFDGGLDEVRISTTNRSQCWTQTEYNNQSSPATFYTIGA